MTASPIMDAVRAMPKLGHIKGTDHDLLLWLLRSRHGWEPGQPRWSHVRDMSGHGSSVGSALCVAVGVDPDEVAPQDDGENCPRCGSLLERDEDDEEPEPMSHAMHHVKISGGPLQVMTATDPIDAIRSICRVLTLQQQLTAGRHDVAVRLATETDWTRGVIHTDADGMITVGAARWGLPTPAEPIPDSGVLPHGVPDV